MIYKQLKALPVHRAMLEVSELLYETCKTYLKTQGKFLLILWVFIAVIIGRQQLFTENTLYPVVLVLDERKHFLTTLRLWIVVFSSNIAGALLFAALCSYTTALKPEIKTKLVELGVTAVQGSFGHFFWSGVVGGWLIALVAWMVSASHRTILKTSAPQT